MVDQPPPSAMDFSVPYSSGTGQVVLPWRGPRLHLTGVPLLYVFTDGPS